MFIKTFLKVCVTGVVTLAALALFIAPRAVADTNKNIDGGVNVTSTLHNLKQKSWENVVQPQLARRNEQEVKRVADENAAKEARKAEEARVIASQPVAAPSPPPAPIGGNKESWMAAAGISPSDYTYVDYIISKESGWNPNAVNKSSGAGGLPQALPYSKTGCAVGDPICQLKWANGYAVNRYGSWAGAYQFWISRHWW